jgi:hypothetical protein
MKICIIGNGESTLYKKNGNFIDSCEIVIRLGNFQTKNYEQYIGSKTDIYCSRWYKAKHKPKEFFLNIKEMWIPRTHDTREKKYDHLIEKLNLLYKIKYIPNNLIYKYKIKFPYRLSISKNSKNTNKNLYCSLPDSGIIAIDMAIINYPNSKLYISGFDNCKTNSHYWDTNCLIDKLSEDMLAVQEAYLNNYLENNTIINLCN